jgi:intracellular sulfur oxidation DsrE/DsrF family protein
MNSAALLIGSLAALVLLASSPASLAGETVVHKVAIHVDENDPKRMNLALNNAENITRHYRSKGEAVQIEMVAYGPGLHMFRQDTSPVKDRIAAMSLEYDNMSFAACGNTKRKMSEAAGKDIPIISEATMVPSGVVRLMELQEQGWSYVRP